MFYNLMIAAPATASAADVSIQKQVTWKVIRLFYQVS